MTLARQGLDTAYAWGLGKDDPASQSILAELDREGVDTTRVVEDEKYQAGYSVIMIATNGERTILNHRGHTFTSRSHKLRLDDIKQFDWVYPTSLGDDTLTLLREVVDAAEANGAKVMLNPAGSEFAELDKLKGLLDSVDVLCVNKEEMQLLVSGETCEG